MKRSKMYLSVCCILVLMIVFAILSIVYFNSQNASAQIPTSITASVEMKISHESQDDHVQENRESIKELKRIIEDDLKSLDLTVVQSTNGHSEADWKIYSILRVHGPIVSISVTLTHQDKFIMNSVAVVDLLTPESEYRIKNSQDRVKAGIEKPIKLALNILSQKLKNKHTTVIVTDDSTIVVNN